MADSPYSVTIPFEPLVHPDIPRSMRHEFRFYISPPDHSRPYERMLVLHSPWETPIEHTFDERALMFDGRHNVKRAVVELLNEMLRRLPHEAMQIIREARDTEEAVRRENAKRG